MNARAPATERLCDSAEATGSPECLADGGGGKLGGSDDAVAAGDVGGSEARELPPPQPAHASTPTTNRAVVTLRHGPPTMPLVCCPAVGTT